MTLCQCAKRLLMNDEYKVENLQISLGTVVAQEHKMDWYRHCTIEKNVEIPKIAQDNKVDGTMEVFCFPERNEEKNEVMFKTFDYTHILTNMKSHILNRGYEFCKKEDFKWIVDNTNGVLSRYLVQYNMDNQNAFSAMKMFGNEVILTLESNGRQDSVEFLKLVQGWHMACDERGLSADVRVHALYCMHKFLTNNINFWSVPFQFPGRYIRGMTWQTFEALLHTIST